MPSPSGSEIVDSTAIPPKGDGFAFRGWRYITALASFEPNGLTEPICIDGGCGMLVASKAFIQHVIPTATISKQPATVMVRKLGSPKYPSN
jgi:hypothetical protein